MVKALIIVDVQNDFCQGGRLAVPRSLQIIPIINQLKRHKKFFKHIFLSKDWHPQNHISFANTHNLEPFNTIQIGQKIQQLWPIHCVAQTQGANIHPEIEIHEQDQIIHKGIYEDKDSYSAFFNGQNGVELKIKLQQKGVKEVYVCGLATDYCVGSTALDAVEYGFKTFIIKQACKGVSHETIQAMMKRLKQKNVELVSINSILQ